MAIENPPRLIDYWHDLYLREVNARYTVYDVLVDTEMSAQEKLIEIAKVIDFHG